MPIHDQNFKNLILDYPRQALELFAGDEGRSIPADARITPIRQEQLQKRLGERFFELDAPLLVEWPSGLREALIFLVEEISNTSPWNLFRIAMYCLARISHQRVLSPQCDFCAGRAKILQAVL